MPFGLTPEGFVPKTLEILVDDMELDVKEQLGIVPVGVFKKFIGILSERHTELWELGEVLSSSMDPNAATGTQLDGLTALTGTIREAPFATSGIVTLTGTPGTIVITDSVVSSESTGVEFQTKEDVTFDAATVWAITTAYIVGDRVTNGGNVYICITAGTSAGSGGPTTESEDITDGTVHWRFVGNGTGFSDVLATATITGPIVAESGDINTIETPVFGWDSVINLLDADVGANVEQDGQLRMRRTLELTSSGDSTADAIRADLLQNIPNVVSVNVFNNNTDFTDADGVPPHTVEILVKGGDDQDIWDAILDAVPVGIGTFGDEEGTSIDDEGEEQIVRFSRPEEIEIYVDVELTKNVKTYPLDGNDQVKSIIVLRGDEGDTGLDAVASRISAWVFGVSGVLDVTLLQIGTAPSPSASTTIAISSRQLAVFDTSRITVVSIDGTP